jgi:DNA-binding MarR family transcriptional regulator
MSVRPIQLVPPIHRATHRIGLYLADLREDGLSQGEAHILALLAAHAPATIAELHRGLAHKRSTLTSILDRLTARRLVTREVGASDRRTFLVRLTPEGRAAARRLHTHLSSLETSVLDQTTEADVRGFLNVLALVEAEAVKLTVRAPAAHGDDARRRAPGRLRETRRSAPPG